MFGCSAQYYGYSPACVNVCSNVCFGAISGLKFGEESNSPLGCAFSPDTTVCGCVSSFVHVTVAPTLTSTGFGENAVSVRVEEPGTMETLVAAPPPPVAPVGVARLSAPVVALTVSPESAVRLDSASVVALVLVAPPSAAVPPASSVVVTLVPVALTTDKVWFWAPGSVATSVALAAGPAVAFPAVAFAAIGGPLTMSLPFGGTIVPAG